MQPSSYASKHPYLFTIFLVLAIIVIYLIAGTAVALLKLPNNDLYFSANLGLALLGALLLTGMHFWKGVGFRPLVLRRDLRLYWLPLILVVLNLIYGVEIKSASSIAYYFVLAGMVGFVEEVYFRGFILRALAPKGTVRAIIISSVLFGLLHSLNVLGGSNALYTLLQVVYALAIGLAFAAITLRTGVIWPLVIIHALIDFTSFIASGRVGTSSFTTLDVVIALLTTVAFTAYAIYFMRSTRSPQLSVKTAP